MTAERYSKIQQTQRDANMVNWGNLLLFWVLYFSTDHHTIPVPFFITFMALAAYGIICTIVAEVARRRYQRQERAEGRA